MSRTMRVLGWPAFANRAEQPYNAFLYEHLRKLGVEVVEYSAGRALGGGYSILHLHWPERRVRDRSPLRALARSGALVALLDAVRRHGTRVVWTVHNLEAHEGRYHGWLEPRFWRAFTRRLDAVLSLSPSGLMAVRDRYPALRDVPGFVVPIGHYRTAYPHRLRRAEARAFLGIPDGARVAAFLGQVRPYKGVTHLVRAFRGLADPWAVLLVAGVPKPMELEEEIRAAAGGDPRVRIVPEFVPEEEVQHYLAAANLVVLPYRRILNSGSAVLALSFDRPVLVPRIGAMEDLAAQVGPDWVRTYEGELTPALLEEALEWAARPRPAEPPLEEMEWDRVARLTLEAYRAVLA